MRIMKEEIFGPVLDETVDSEGIAIELANDPSRLGASVHQDRDKQSAWREIQSGSVWVNDHSSPAPASALGRAGTGLGRSHSKFGFTMRQRGWSAGSRAGPDFWWRRTTVILARRFGLRLIPTAATASA
jgi:acyl-CoA reductase-like NAD-dependent aldehyde dehydrogenase